MVLLKQNSLKTPNDLLTISLQNCTTEQLSSGDLLDHRIGLEKLNLSGFFWEQANDTFL